MGSMVSMSGGASRNIAKFMSGIACAGNLSGLLRFCTEDFPVPTTIKRNASPQSLCASLLAVSTSLFMVSNKTLHIPLVCAVVFLDALKEPATNSMNAVWKFCSLIGFATQYFATRETPDSTVPCKFSFSIAETRVCQNNAFPNVKVYAPPRIHVVGKAMRNCLRSCIVCFVGSSALPSTLLVSLGITSDKISKKCIHFVCSGSEELEALGVLLLEEDVFLFSVEEDVEEVLVEVVLIAFGISLTSFGCFRNPKMMARVAISNKPCWDEGCKTERAWVKYNSHNFSGSPA